MKLHEAIDHVENMPTSTIIKWLEFFDKLPQHQSTNQHANEQIITLVNKMEAELEQRGEQEARTKQHA